MDKKFLFVRHGETDWNRLKKIQGHTDIELNENGRLKAKDVAHIAKKYPISHVYVSPLKRALETAHIIMSHFPDPVSYTMIDSLKERGWGDLEGKLWSEMQVHFDQEHLDPHYEVGFNVEPYLAFGKRIKETLDHILIKESLPLIVSHGGVFKNMVKQLGIPKVDSVSNTQLIELVCKKGVWSLAHIDL